MTWTHWPQYNSVTFEKEMGCWYTAQSRTIHNEVQRWPRLYLYMYGYGTNSTDNSVWNMLLTHWGRDKMDAISQTPFSSAFFLNGNVWISINISLKVVPKGPINNIPALVQIMVMLPTHICATWPQWVNWKHTKLLCSRNSDHNLILLLQCSPFKQHRPLRGRLIFWLTDWRNDNHLNTFKTLLTYTNGIKNLNLNLNLNLKNVY